MTLTAELIRFPMPWNSGQYHLPRDEQKTLCGQQQSGRGRMTLHPDHRPHAEAAGLVCRLCLHKERTT